MKWINQFLNYILFVVIAICLGIFGSIYFEKSNQNEKSVQKKLSPDDLVNKYMKQAQADIAKQERDSVNKIKSTLSQNKLPQTKSKDISMSDIPVEKQIAKDNSMAGDQSLTETFDRKSYESQAYQIEDQQAKKEYAKTFIENAKKNGYHITLSDDLQVTSVKPIRKPTNQANDNDTFESDPSN